VTPERWRELSRLFNEALALDGPARAAFVRDACGADDALRRDVLSLLAEPSGDGIPGLPPWARDQLLAMAAAPAAASDGLATAEPADGAAASLAGRQLGPYEVRQLLGAGGMGRVYLARDTVLGRDVAIKVLPPALAADPARRGRFEQEARLLAALNHPRIGAIYGVQESGGVRGLVLELVDGETLAERLERGPLPIAEALAVADQIADALDAAHVLGIVHRDLKPANVKLRPDGTVKLLDLGLAKLLSSGSSEDALPTLADAAVTRDGAVLGTPSYMSPEQARGQAVDRRADVWAFGCVLYEMLTGRRPFPGRTVSDTIAAILERGPDLAALPASVPPQVHWVMKRCLAKEPSARLRDIGDVRHALADAAAEPAAAGPAAPASSTRLEHRLRAWRWLALGALATAVVVGAAAWWPVGKAREEPRRVTLSLAPPPGARFRWFAISPDGERLAYVATDSQQRDRLYVRPLESLVAEPLAGTEGARQPFWSPDGRSLAFFAGGMLKRVDAAGGPVQTLCEALLGVGGSWGAGGAILFAPSTRSPILRVPASGGTPEPVTTIDTAAQENSHRWPVFLPDGRRFLYVVRSHPIDQGGTFVGSLDSSTKVRLTGSDAFTPPALTSGPDGRALLLFVDRATLFARQLDLTRLELVGESVRAAERVGTFSVSERGVLVYDGSRRRRGNRLVWYDRAGRELARVGPSAEYINVSLSPDGRRAAVDRVDAERGDTDIWIVETESGQATRLTSHPALDVTPVWSPDGARVAFMSARSSPNAIFSRAADGSGSDEPLVRPVGHAWPFHWSLDGRHLLYYDTDPATGRDLWALPTTGEPRPIPVVRTSADEQVGQFSPDGRFVAYVGNETGRMEIYVRPFTTSGAPHPGWRISSAGGGSPRWRRDGGELFYLAEGKPMAATVRTAPTFQFDSPRPLGAPAVGTEGFLPYDVAPDGRRFLMTADPDFVQSSDLTVVLDWTGAAAARPLR
jgi:Tol biopolymer transport system component